MFCHNLQITDIYAREILDSRGNPTVETEVILNNTYVGRASVPSGASTGSFEAVELRDGEKRYFGKGVRRAVENVNRKITPLLLGKNALEQRSIDQILIDADGTEDKSNLGANGILSVSLATAKAAAKGLRIPLYQYLGGVRPNILPVPMMNVINGGPHHGKNSLDFQEFMIVPVGAEKVSEGIRMGAEVYYHLKILLLKHGMSVGVGDEGGFNPDFYDTAHGFSFLEDAVRQAGYEPGRDVCFALDAAASELYVEKKGIYEFPGESKMSGKKVERTTEEMISYYEKLVKEFPIISIEDGLYENDWDGWSLMTEKLGKKIQLVGDDLFVTNQKRLKLGIEKHAANAVLIKLNQIGTLSEALDTVDMAMKNGYRTVISHRSGETADSLIADLSVAVNAGQIKTGAPCRMERVEKYNQLLRIEESMGISK